LGAFFKSRLDGEYGPIRSLRRSGRPGRLLPNPGL